MVDLKQGLGDVSLFLGVRSRFSILDAIDGATRLDREFLTGLVAKHVSGLELLPGSDQFDRPTSADGEIIENVLRLLSSRYEYMVVDGGAQITAASLAALYVAEMIAVVINPDVPSIRNGQRMIERISQMGSCGERVRVLLNRAAAPYPDSDGADRRGARPEGPSDVPQRLQNRVDSTQLGGTLTFSDNSDMADQFKRLTGLIMHGSTPQKKTPSRKMSLGLPRFASMW